MATIVIKDLEMNHELDKKALSRIMGGFLFSPYPSNYRWEVFHPNYGYIGLGNAALFTAIDSAGGLYNRGWSFGRYL